MEHSAGAAYVVVKGPSEDLLAVAEVGADIGVK